MLASPLSVAGASSKEKAGPRRASRPGNGPRSAPEPAMLYPFAPTLGSSSPWGPIQTVEPLGPDAAAVTTASHGGLRVSPAALARLPEAIRETPYSHDGWFEEDCDWALPYLALGLDAFELDAACAAERWAAAVRTVQRYHPQHVVLLGVKADASGGRQV